MKQQDELYSSSQDQNSENQLQILNSKILEDLHICHQFAKIFIENLNQIKQTPILEHILHYCKEIKHLPRNHQHVLDLLQSRINKMVKNHRLKKNWSEEDLQLLIWLTSKYMEKTQITSHEHMQSIDWTYISKMIPGSSAKSCLFRFISLKKFKLSNFKWNKEQEKIFSKVVGQIGVGNWKNIAYRIYELNPKKRIYRTPKQCREHWSCYMNPQIKKGPWDYQQDRKLLQIVLKSNCQKKWSLMKKNFEGRTQNSLKNRYNLLINKQKKKLFDEDQEQKKLILEILKDIKESQQINFSTPEENKQIELQKTEVKSQSQKNLSLKQLQKNQVFPIVPEQIRHLSPLKSTQSTSFSPLLFYVNKPQFMNQNMVNWVYYPQ